MEAYVDLEKIHRLLELLLVISLFSTLLRSKGSVGIGTCIGYIRCERRSGSVMFCKTDHGC